MQLPFADLKFEYWFSLKQEIITSWILLFAKADMKTLALKKK